MDTSAMTGHASPGTWRPSRLKGELNRSMHLFALNRGILSTPFPKMALIEADVIPDDVDVHTRIIRGAAVRLLG
ncbi:MAG: hypothetical protein ABSB41_11870 [Anaerolineales bacterium]|jgi:hypothetical protein